MPGSKQTSIEELVMSSARTYLYGHSLAWGAPGQPRRPARSGATLRSRFGSVRPAGRRMFGSRGVVAVEPGGCA